MPPKESNLQGGFKSDHFDKSFSLFTREVQGMVVGSTEQEENDDPKMFRYKWKVKGDFVRPEMPGNRRLEGRLVRT